VGKLIKTGPVALRLKTDETPIVLATVHRYPVLPKVALPPNNVPASKVLLGWVPASADTESKEISAIATAESMVGFRMKRVLLSRSNGMMNAFSSSGRKAAHIYSILTMISLKF
jgi:hypothetical protein